MYQMGNYGEPHPPNNKLQQDHICIYKYIMQDNSKLREIHGIVDRHRRNHHMSVRIEGVIL